jgi:hypothetical protein
MYWAGLPMWADAPETEAVEPRESVIMVGSVAGRLLGGSARGVNLRRPRSVLLSLRTPHAGPAAAGPDGPLLRDVTRFGRRSAGRDCQVAYALFPRAGTRRSAGR